jgi:hypothetical protein
MSIYREDRFADQTREVAQERVENYDVIRRHDLAVMNYFSFWVPYQDLSTNTLREKMVPMVFATPRREASERDIHEMDDTRRTAMEWDGDYPPTALERIVYPSIAVTRLDLTFDQVRFTYAPWRKLLYSDDLNMVLQSNFPLPYNFTYQFDFWVLDQAELNMMMEQWARKFPRPTYYVDVLYPPPWGEQGVHMQSSGLFANTSTLEGGEQQRELRGVATVTLFGWIPLPTSWVRTVQKITLELVEQESETILQTLETEWANKPTFWETGDTSQVLEWK